MKHYRVKTSNNPSRMMFQFGLIINTVKDGNAVDKQIKDLHLSDSTSKKYEEDINKYDAQIQEMWQKTLELAGNYTFVVKQAQEYLDSKGYEGK